MNGRPVDLSNLEDSLCHLWNENLQLKLNLSRLHASHLNGETNDLLFNSNQFSRLFQLQRRVRLHKLNSLRIPRLSVKGNSKTGGRYNANCTAIAEDAGIIINNLEKDKKIGLSSELGKLRSRLFFKRKTDQTNNEYTIKKLVLESDATFYRRLLF